MIKPFKEVNDHWEFFNWDEWDIIRRKIGEDKFEEIKDNLYDILEHVYEVGFNEGFIDARHCWYKYIDKVRNIVMDFFKSVMKENKDSKEDILKFVYNIIEIDTDDIIKNKDD